MFDSVQYGRVHCFFARTRMHLEGLSPSRFDRAPAFLLPARAGQPEGQRASLSHPAPAPPLHKQMQWLLLSGKRRLLISRTSSSRSKSVVVAACWSMLRLATLREQLTTKILLLKEEDQDISGIAR